MRKNDDCDDDDGGDDDGGGGDGDGGDGDGDGDDDGDGGDGDDGGDSRHDWPIGSTQHPLSRAQFQNKIPLKIAAGVDRPRARCRSTRAP